MNEESNMWFAVLDLSAQLDAVIGDGRVGRTHYHRIVAYRSTGCTGCYWPMDRLLNAMIEAGI